MTEETIEHWERMREKRDTVHSEQCWKWHPVCALRRAIEDLRRER